MRIPMTGLDTIGVISDVNPHSLPNEAWSRGRNVRFANGQIEKVSGHQGLVTPEVAPYTLMPLNTTDGYYWIYAGQNHAYAWRGNTHRLVTRAAGQYAAQPNTWTGGVLNGVAILNNPNDIPQAWVNVGSALENLPNWDTNWKCRSLRPFKYYLVALGVKEGPNDNPYRVLWSHAADPGTVPSSWDITDPTKDAGDYILAETEGHLVDQLSLRGTNIIYKTDSVYVMQHIGGMAIMGFRLLFEGSGGLLMPNGVRHFNHNGDYHLVFGPHQIYAHDGASMQPVLKNKMNNWLYNNLDSEYAERSFIMHKPGEHELHVCFPETGSQWPNLAVVWNYLENKTTVKDMPETSCSGIGKMASIEDLGHDDTWGNEDSQTWDSDQATWGGDPYTSVVSQTILAFPEVPKIALDGVGTTFDGIGFKSIVERVGLAVLGQDAKGRPIYESDMLKLVTEIWPRIKGDDGTKIDIYIGAQDKEQDPVTWEGPLQFVVGQDEKVDCYTQGKILSIRFETETQSHWELAGYDLEVIGIGKN